MSITKNLLTWVLVSGLGLTAQFVSAATPAGHDELIFHTGKPKRNGETIISTTVRWRLDQDMRYESSGLGFVHGPDEPRPDGAQSIAKRMTQSLKEGLMKQLPDWRGVVPSSKDDPNDPQFIMRNPLGLSFLEVTVRDYSNQEFTVETGSPSFSSANVEVAIDIVDALAIDKVSIFEGATTEADKNFVAEGGTVKVTIGGQTVSFETAKKSLDTIEKAIAAKFGGSVVSSSPLFSVSTDGDLRNVRQFDGGEVRFTNLSEKQISVDIDDPSLAVITKFKYPDQNVSSLSAIEPYLFWIFVALVGAGVCYGYLDYRKKQTRLENPS